jgi:hypothetical protein
VAGGSALARPTVHGPSFDFYFIVRPNFARVGFSDKTCLSVWANSFGVFLCALIVVIMGIKVV